LAARHLEAALALSRGLLDQRLEGLVLGYLGALHTRQSDFGAARACLDEAGARLRLACDPLSLGILQCIQAEFHWMTGDSTSAREALDCAISTAISVNADARSELGLVLARVRTLIGAHAQPVGLTR
jgi:hypothetical protein